jgi:hypothetical protein
LEHTVCGNRDAPQFAHSECAGAVSFRFAARRERVRDRVNLRFGTGMAEVLLISQ